MKTFKFYLAGAMTGISFDESNVYRETAKEWLESRECNFNVTAINPNDYYNFLEKRHETEKEILRFDLNMIRTSDLILVNLNGKSIGTAMELMLAYELHKPIVGFIADKSELHPWLDYVCDRVFNEMDLALKYIEEYYLV
jgi:nucleoside 2-deoxyribosyltransferase